MTELLLGRPAGALVAEHFAAHDFALHAPDWSTSRSSARSGDGSPPARRRSSARPRASTTCTTCRSNATRTTTLAPRIWELRETFSAYDASYVALAEAVEDDAVPLLPADARLGRAIGAHPQVPVLLAA